VYARAAAVPRSSTDATQNQSHARTLSPQRLLFLGNDASGSRSVRSLREARTTLFSAVTSMHTQHCDMATRKGPSAPRIRRTPLTGQEAPAPCAHATRTTRRTQMAFRKAQKRFLTKSGSHPKRSHPKWSHSRPNKDPPKIDPPNREPPKKRNPPKEGATQRSINGAWRCDWISLQRQDAETLPVLWENPRFGNRSDMAEAACASKGRAAYWCPKTTPSH
jgi:hypothetical protein